MTAKTFTATPPAQRRRFLAALTGMTSALVAPTVATAAADKTSIEAIRKAANSLADAMAARYGARWGHDWQALVDHDTGFVLIQPIPSRKRQRG